jgi:hypothetical protein
MRGRNRKRATEEGSSAESGGESPDRVQAPTVGGAEEGNSDVVYCAVSVR